MRVRSYTELERVETLTAQGFRVDDDNVRNPAGNIFFLYPGDFSSEAMR